MAAAGRALSEAEKAASAAHSARLPGSAATEVKPRLPRALTLQRDKKLLLAREPRRDLLIYF